ncbi:MAG: hypothetical protein K6F21_02080 [Bacteroidales bacterium]|nr:hypothetical protein [Bacteroidales bacterium]
MTRATLITILFSLLALNAAAQENVRFISDTTETVETYSDINDYDLLGFNYGVTFSQMMFNPPVKQSWMFSPMYMSLTYTHYLKLFDYMPFFGYQLGIAYGKEGYRFKENEDTGTIYKIEGATEAVMDVIEVPFLAHFHYDALHFKIMVNGGLYGGYRRSIVRRGPSVTEGLEKSFAETDRQPDYGLQGGLGIGLVFSPLEFHVNALLRYSWSSIYTPDSSPSKYNQYYYRFAYPLDVNITAGIYIQLTKRTGRTSRDLKRQAKEIVIKGWELENEHTESKDR